MLRWSRPPTSLNDLMDAILENRRLILAMADQLATALADLNTSVSTLQSNVSAATADISSLLQQLLNAAGTGLTQEMIDAAAQIEARVGDINAASTALGDAVAQPVAGNTTAAGNTTVVDPATGNTTVIDPVTGNTTVVDPATGNTTTGNLSIDPTA